jgi:hypothetical protein
VIGEGERVAGGEAAPGREAEEGASA